jgi:hypothetical protein
MQARPGASEGSASAPAGLDEPEDSAVEVGRSSRELERDGPRRRLVRHAGASAGCATTRAGRASSSTCASSAGGCDTAKGTATPPAHQIRPLDGYVLPTRRDEKADARLLEVPPAVEESLGDRARRGRQVPVGERAVRGDDRRPAAVASARSNRASVMPGRRRDMGWGVPGSSSWTHNRPRPGRRRQPGRRLVVAPARV